MIILRDMQQEEYADFCQYFIDDYSKEIAKNYNHSLDVAIELAQKELQRCLVNGLDSNEHSLLCIDTNVDGQSNRVGYLWHSLNTTEHTTFIYDFFVSARYRGLGYGTQAIAALESELKLAGIHQIKLRVAYHNERALKLYKAVGFNITGFNMAKNI